MPIINIILILIFSLSAQARMNVCSMTLNSSNELNEFKKSFAPLKAKFVELTQSEGNLKNETDWLKTSCDKEIQCDILIISGHFAGSFWGSRQTELTLKQLKNASCRSTCDGILKRPREVFLFGCNTLSHQGSELNNLDLYFDDLISAGYQPTTAQRISSHTTSEPQDYVNTMRSVFSHVPRIYGFNGKAPLGKDISPFLQKYLQNAQVQKYYYPKNFNKIDNSKNLILHTEIQKVNSNFIQSFGNQQLTHEYCNQNKEENTILLQMKMNDSDFAKLSLKNKLQILEIYVENNFLTKADYIDFFKKELFDPNTSNFSYQLTQKICSLDFIQNAILTTADFNYDLFNNRNFIITLGCLKTTNYDLQLEIVERLSASDMQLANAAYFTLKSLSITDKKVIEQLKSVRTSSYSRFAQTAARDLLRHIVE